MTLADIVRRFDARQSGSGYTAHCPSHKDGTASLSINCEGDKILIHCHAGCSLNDVLRAKGLKQKDLFVNGRDDKRSSRVVATYDYRDEAGTLRYRKQRRANKQFWFERPDGHGGWVANMKGVKRLVYRLDDLHEQSADASTSFRVWSVEGEKDSDRLWSQGLPATTNDGGASQDGRAPKWKHAHTQQLRDIGVTEVCCLRDYDDAGRAHRQAVADSCHAAGLVVRMVELPGNHPTGFDVSDWLDAGHTADELIALADATEVYEPHPATEVPPEVFDERTVTTPRTLAEVHATFRRWLGEHYDLDALDAVLATAAAERLDGDPVWLNVLSGPGNAKTETVQALSGVGAICVSAIASEGALLSASPKREQSKQATGGLLRQVGQRGILVVKDLTSILSMQTNIRAPLLSALREVHDGRWVRNVGTDGGKTLTWTGRIVIIAACTTAWDTHHSAISTMGDRFVLLRMDSRTGRESAGRHAIGNTGRETDMRAELADAVAGLLQTVDPKQAIALSEAEVELVLAAANITALCRTGVDYDYRGNPIEAHMPEMPTRFAKQLAQIIRGGVAVGMKREEAMQLAIRCAKDSMPPMRLAILRDLWQTPGSELNEIRVRLDMPRSTVKRQLESLHLLQALTCTESSDTYEDQLLVENDDPTPKRRLLKRKTVTRYWVADGLKSEALGLGPSAVTQPL